jgi:hypothetical protein
MRLFTYIFIVLGIIAVLGAAMLWVYRGNRPSLNGQLFYISHLDITRPQNLIYFQGKVLDSKRRDHHTVFSLDIEKCFMRQIGSRGIDILDPVVR